MTVKELYDKYDKSAERWSLSIYDMSGNVQLGYCNRVYSFDAVPEDIKEREVVNFSVGFESVVVKLDIPFLEYPCTEACEQDGYSMVYPEEKGFATKILFHKTENGKRVYAFVDVLKEILNRSRKDA